MFEPYRGEKHVHPWANWRWVSLGIGEVNPMPGHERRCKRGFAVELLNIGCGNSKTVCKSLNFHNLSLWSIRETWGRNRIIALQVLWVLQRQIRKIYTSSQCPDRWEPLYGNLVTMGNMPCTIFKTIPTEVSVKSWISERDFFLCSSPRRSPIHTTRSISDNSWSHGLTEIYWLVLS